MSNSLLLRMFISDRLSVAAEEIFAFVERTIIEYEVEVSRSKREIDRQSNLLDIVLNPQLKLKRTEAKHVWEKQHCEVELSVNLSQHDMEPQRPFKEEPQELITTPAGEQPEELEQLDAIQSRSTLTFLPSGSDQQEPRPLSHRDGIESQAHTETIIESSGTYTAVDSTSCFQALPTPNPERSTGASNCTSGILDWMGSTQARSKLLTVEQITCCLKSQRTRKRKAILGRDALGRTTYTCPVCAKCLNSPGALSKHQDIHDGARYPCPHCGKNFGRLDHLKTHVLIHVGVKPFSCTECGKRFRLKTGLKEHIKTHTGDRPFSCALCGKRFSSNSNHNRHQKTHTRERPYRCTVCDKSFRYATDIKRHMSKFHPAN